MKRLMFSLVVLWSLTTGAWADDAAGKIETLATFQDMKIDSLDWEVFLSRIPPAKREVAANARQINLILENIMVYRMLAKQARELGIDKDPLIEREVQQVVESTLGRRRLEAFRAGLKVPDLSAAAEEYYKVNGKEFQEPETREVAHVLVTPRENRDFAVSQKLAESIAAKAKQGSDFSALADQYSDDPSVKTNHGVIGVLEPGKLVPEFEKAALALTKVGEISPVVKSSFGYHVIKLIGYRPAKQRSFQDVKADIVKRLEEKFRSEEEALFLAKLRADPTLKQNDDAFEHLLKR